MHHASADQTRLAVRRHRALAQRRPVALLAGLLCALLVACGGGGGGGTPGGGGRAVALGVSSGYEGVTVSSGIDYSDGSGDGSPSGDGGASAGGGDGEGAGAGAGLGTFRNAKVTVERADRTVVGSALTDRFGMVSIRNGGDKQPLLITVEGGPDARYWEACHLADCEVARRQVSRHCSSSRNAERESFSRSRITSPNRRSNSGTDHGVRSYVRTS